MLLVVVWFERAEDTFLISISKFADAIAVPKETLGHLWVRSDILALGRQKLEFAAQARHLLDKCRSGKASKLLCARNHCPSVPSRLLCARNRCSSMPSRLLRLDKCRSGRASKLLCARNHCSRVPSRLLQRSKSMFERAFEATVRSKSLYEESCARPQRRSAPLRSAPLHSVHVYARVHTSIYIYVYIHVYTYIYVYTF